MQKITLCLLSVCLSFTGIQAQQPKITPVSPEAASLSKMINFPVSYNTGIPDIGIPLYEIKTGGLTLPITLNYHAGGFKIQERATSVGLGWSLSSDIQISRTINGLDDFGPMGYISNALIKTYGSCSTCGYPLYTSASPFTYYEAYRIAAGEADGMPDKFYYKLLNKSGSFYFRKTTSGTGYTIVPVPYDNINITLTNGQFTITDTDGTMYYFGGQGVISPGNIAEKATELSESDLTVHSTAFKCTRIENPTKTEAINFMYTAKTPLYFSSANQSVEYFNNPNAGYMNLYYTADAISTAHPGVVTYESLMALIPFYNLSSPKWIEHFGYGKSRFHLPYLNSQNQVVDKTYEFQTNPGVPGQTVYGLALSRIDFNGGSVLFNGTDKINDITVKNALNEEIKTFSLFQSNAPPFNLASAQARNGAGFIGTAYLDSVQCKVNGLSYETYKLKYASKFCFGSHIQGKDAWGYSNSYTSERLADDTSTTIPRQKIIQGFYKGPNGGYQYIPNLTFSFGSSINAENTDITPISRGMLTRIIYPTGGYTTFGYEGNMIRLNLPNHLTRVVMTGGVRIKTISNFDGKDQAPVSQKYYRYGELEDGIGLGINPPRNDTVSATDQSNNLDAYTYTQTTGYLTGPGPIYAGFDFAPVSPSCANRSCLTLRQKEDKTIYQPASYMDYTYPNGAPIYYTKVTEYNQDFGVQTGKKVYTYSNPNDYGAYSYQTVSKIPGTNIDVLQTDGLMGVPTSIQDFKYDKGSYTLVHSKLFSYTKYSKPEQIRVVYSFFTTLYNVIGGSYNGSPMDFYNTTYSFAAGSLSEPFYTYIAGEYGIQVAKLLLSTETERWTTGTDTITTVTNYEYGNNLYVQPSKITASTSTGSRSKAFRYAYDAPGVSVYDQMLSGNRISEAIEEIEMKDNIETARVKTNFGVFNNPAFIAPASVQRSFGGNVLDTVLKYDLYDQRSNPLQVTGKGAQITSYLWAYNYKYLVAEITGETYANATAGINVTALQTNTNDAQIKAIVNAMRTSLPSAMVSTHFYKPLIGISCETRPNGTAVYYDYDPYGRLATIKDNDMHILKKYDYQYIPATSSLANTLYYASSPMMQTYNNLRTIPNGVDTITVNAVQYGGKYLGANWTQLDVTSEETLQSYSSTLPPAANNAQNAATVSIDLGINIWPAHTRSNGVYIDFIKDNSIVYSKKFPSGVNYITLKIQPGEYKIGIRYNENYNGSLTGVSVGLSNGTYYYLKPGDTSQFVNGTVYTITASNMIFQ